jgi:hypothetical protein
VATEVQIHTLVTQGAHIRIPEVQKIVYMMIWVEFLVFGTPHLPQVLNSPLIAK